MGALLVVDGHELVQELLQLDQVGGLVGLGAQPPLQGLLEPLDLAAGGGLVRAAVLLLDLAAAQLGLQAWRPPRPPAKRVVKTIPLSVKVEAGTPKRATAARKRSRTIGPVTGWWAVTSRA